MSIIQTSAYKDADTRDTESSSLEVELFYLNFYNLSMES